MNRKFKYLLILLSVTLLFAGYQYFKQAGIQAYRYVGTSKVTLDKLPNGSYSGTFQPFNLISLAKVKFRIDGGKVKDFSIPRLVVSPWNQVKSPITDSVEVNQSVHFDAISGATRSSYFVKAALHNACPVEKDSIITSQP